MTQVTIHVTILYYEIMKGFFYRRLMSMLNYIQNMKYVHKIIWPYGHSVPVCCSKELWMTYEATSDFVSFISEEEVQHPQEPTWRTCSWS